MGDAFEFIEPVCMTLLRVDHTTSALSAIALSCEAATGPLGLGACLGGAALTHRSSFL
jgi:hypothetical protein